MRILPIQDVYQKKFERQRKIKELSYHGAGHCVHLGKISPGCYGCFVPDPYRRSIVVGSKCNADCLYCGLGPTVRGNKRLKDSGLPQYLSKEMCMSMLGASKPDYQPSAISFTGGGEPLMHMDVLETFMAFYEDLHKNLKKKPWYYLYTNGLLADRKVLDRLKALGFDEVRFHLGASGFSEKVYDNMRYAVKCFKAVSVETPAWKFHRKKLFEMLPKIEEIGVKHLNITEVELNSANFERISKLIPDGEICQCGALQLYDDGLVYDLMEEVVRRKYSYSVLDCGCFVKSIQRTSGKWVYAEGIDGLCADYG